MGAAEGLPFRRRDHVNIRSLLQQFHTAGVVGEDFLSVVLGNNNGRQLVNHDVDLAVVYQNIGSGHELRLLVDRVQSSKFITREKAREITAKLKKVRRKRHRGKSEP